MPQVFHVVQCYSCATFQVHQVKKVTKWACKLCGEKQSLKKVFGQGTGAECREHVQKLNTRRGELGEVAQLKPCHEVLYDVTSGSQQSDVCSDNPEFHRQDMKVQNNKWDMFVDSEVGNAKIDEEEGKEDKMFTTDASIYKRGRKRKRVKSGKDSLEKRSAKWCSFTDETISAQDEYNSCDIPGADQFVYDDNGQLKNELNAYDSDQGSHNMKTNEFGYAPSELNNSNSERHNSYWKFHYAAWNGLNSNPGESGKWEMFDSFETDPQAKGSILKSKVSMNYNLSRGNKLLQKNSVVEDSTLRKECLSALKGSIRPTSNLGDKLEQECPMSVGEDEVVSFSKGNNIDVIAKPRNNVIINKSNRWDLFKEDVEKFSDGWENNESQESDFDTRPYVSFDPSALKRMEMNMPEKGTLKLMSSDHECDNENNSENNNRVLMDAVEADDLKDRMKPTGTVSMLNNKKNRTILCGSKWESFVHDKDSKGFPPLEENETSQTKTICDRDTGLNGKENKTLNAVLDKSYGFERFQDAYSVQPRTGSKPNKALYDFKLKDTPKPEPLFSVGDIDDEDFEL